MPQEGRAQAPALRDRVDSVLVLPDTFRRIRLRSAAKPSNTTPRQRPTHIR
jgi:hypothetical protein